MLTRICTLLAALTLCAGCQGDGGAASARWIIEDLSTGQRFDPRDNAHGNDGLCCDRDFASAGACGAGNAWIVRTVAITVRDPTSGASVLDLPASPCTKREETTNFDLPEGDFAIGITADVVDGQGNPAASQIPPPEVRTIVRGEVVNLQIIEIGVNPLPLPTPSTGVTF